MEEEKRNVMIELFDFTLTENADDRIGKVICLRPARVNDLIARVMKRGTDLSETTLRASYDLLTGAALDELIERGGVEFGLGHYTLGVNGLFTGDHAKWDPAQHSLVIHSTPNIRTRDAVRRIAVSVRGMAASGTFINTVTDVSSGEINTRITPGGGMNLSGDRMRIAGDPAVNGIFFEHQGTGEIRQVPLNAILTNDPKKLAFVVPATLPAGDYKITLVTQYSRGKETLKEPRRYTFEHVLACMG
ncbi:MAG: DUF4469 domain-containing protein [Tannerella sp.]|jgi:hypothetical protein|nr:DUF4469 domain-containing protein [Tannerella sp.]